MNSARSRADKRGPASRPLSGGALRGEWFGGKCAHKLCLLRAEMYGHGRKMQQGKTAIVLFDRVAFCPPAGHLTSSYWAVRIKYVQTAVRSKKTEIPIEALDCRF
jgi:hypothetical protein